MDSDAGPGTVSFRGPCHDEGQFVPADVISSARVIGRSGFGGWAGMKVLKSSFSLLTVSAVALGDAELRRGWDSRP